MPRPVMRASARVSLRLFVFLTIFSLLATPVAAAPGPGGANGRTTEAAPRADAPAPIEAGLLAELKTGETDRFIVEFADQADLSGAADITDFRGRGRFVLDALRGVAAGSQGQAIALVRRTQGARAESFWLRNALLVTGDAELAEQLAALPGVAKVRAERVFPLIKPVETRAAVLAEGLEPEWGVAKVGADAVWAEGITGSGIVVANIDTGVQYDHPALVNQYRGNLGGGSFDHAYSWWDPTGICGDVPCDNAGHGTHTMGTMVGGDGPGPFTPDIGVAPGARWIAAKGCEDLFCSEGALLSSGQFVLAPTDLNGDNPDPGKRPDIVNNSWGSFPGDPFYADVVSAWRAAGIVPVFSIGNSGPGCGSASSPGDFLESFGVGATDIDDLIAGFSSRGPSVYGKVAPDVSAPGVNVVSSVPGDGYAAFDGTSMAAPHTAGTLALVLSAEPGLIGQVDASTGAVRDTAVDILDGQCGGAEDGDPNNVYGDGRIDAAAAVALVATGGTLAGTVTDAVSGDPIGGATISAFNGARTFSTTTAGDGSFSLFLAAGGYAVTAEAFGYFAGTAEAVEIETDATTVADFALDPLPRFTVSGHVTHAASGSAIPDATVLAVGTPVPGATTDADGAYSLELPLGSYTLRATAGGCTDPGFAELELTEDATVDFALARKLDDFGHGCRPITFDWTDASLQTALYGDEFAGRLRLPFAFPFYGESYTEVFISDNGYLNFLGPDQFNSFPIEIPSELAPNAAIYALWQDMWIEGDGAIEYDTIGEEPNRAFVLEFSGLTAGSSSAAFEVKLWENGDIDLLYDEAGDGSNAGIGIENAAGDDALQFSYFADLIGPQTAFRFTEVPTGLVHGTVTDANDGLPVAGALVGAVGSGRSTTTDGDGAYELRLLPGSYELEITADGYETFTQAFSVSAGDVVQIDAALNAPVAAIDPTELSATVELGSSTDMEVTLSNTGTAALTWEARERPTGETPPELPVIEGGPRRLPGWNRPDVPAALPQARTTALPSELLSVIIEDPAGDAAGAIDGTTVRAGADPAEITMEIDFATAAMAGQAAGYVFLDVDQDPTTGLPADAFNGLPTQDIGMEYFVDLFLIHDPEPVVLIVDAATFEIVAVTAARVADETVGFDVPLGAIGGDDGFVNTAMVVGDVFMPTDWLPDEGHGTIEPFSDAPWMSESPESGTVAAGESQVVTVTLGGSEVAAGTYTGQIVFLTNAPRSGPLVVDVSLEVTLPGTFGAVSGTVTDTHTGEPLPASVLIEAEVGGEPYPVAATAGADGTYTAFGPEGTWPATWSLDGYVDATGDVTIIAGATTPGADATLHRAQPHALLEGGPLTFVLPEGRTASSTLVLSNPEGHVDLTFAVDEVDLDAGSTLAAAPAGRSLPEGADSAATTTRGVAPSGALPDAASVHVPGDVLTAWSTGLDLPWGVGYSGNVWLSDAIEGGDACGFIGECALYEFEPDGTPTGTELPAPWVAVFGADMAYDAGRGWLWEVNVDGDNGIYGLDPADGSVQQVLTGAPWSNISQRGLAYDALTDTFYVGGWNEGIVYHVAGPSWPAPGETLDSCAPADPNIAGLAWNPSFRLLWMTTNSEFDTIYLIDPTTCETLQAMGHPEPLFNGAGAELDAAGNLWTVSQASGTAYLLESGLPTFSDAPWLSEDPTEGSVAPDASTEITVTVDTTGLAPGTYRAMVVVQTNDPDNATINVPVLLVVPAYQQGVNAAGIAYETMAGVPYDADRAYQPGSFGYDGRSTGRRTRDDISGTDDDTLYRTMRQGMTAYRFDVPAAGTYQVDLAFAEIVARRAGARVFSVSIEGQVVLPNLDVFAEAGANAALDRTFTVEVTDGTLDVEFVAQRGDQAFVSAILVTHRPDLGSSPEPE